MRSNWNEKLSVTRVLPIWAKMTFGVLSCRTARLEGKFFAREPPWICSLSQTLHIILTPEPQTFHLNRARKKWWNAHFCPGDSVELREKFASLSDVVFNYHRALWKCFENFVPRRCIANRSIFKRSTPDPQTTEEKRLHQAQKQSVSFVRISRLQLITAWQILQRYWCTSALNGKK